MPPEFIIEQVRQVATDIGVDAVKIGMLGTAETVTAVDTALDLLDPSVPIVIDPVMVAESGAVAARRRRPRGARRAADPARHRDHARTSPRRGCSPATDTDDAEELARQLHRLGPHAVVVTGGHRDEVTDVFYDGTTLETLSGPRHPDGAAHGSGCTHSSALAAHLALGDDPLTAARHARDIASEAVRDGLRELGEGPGPVDVFGLRHRLGVGATEASRPATPLA